MSVLCIGDVVGKPGRRALESLSARPARGAAARRRHRQRRERRRRPRPDRADRARTCSPAASTSSRPATTSGTSASSCDDLDEDDGRSCGPLNYPPGAPGRGMLRSGGPDRDQPAGPHLHGDDIDDPFRAADAPLEGRRTPSRHRRYARRGHEREAGDGLVPGRPRRAVVGTHTHVPTADARILPGGTAFVTDAGMTGPQNSVIGIEDRTGAAQVPDRRCRAALRPRSRGRAYSTPCSSTSTKTRAKQGASNALTAASTEFLGDFHLHSTCSDGILPPSGLIELAKTTASPSCR